MKYIAFIIMLMLLIQGCKQEHRFKEKDPFTGLWRLVVLEQQDTISDAWRKYRDGLQGFILYDGRGHMAVHLTSRGYEKFDLGFPNFVDTIPDEALHHLTNSYVYFARYTVDEENNVVEHARISHSNPGLWNEVVYRKYTFLGDTLLLETVDDQPVKLRVKWVRP